jgi:hypothetical protein
MLIYPVAFTNCTKKTMYVHTASLKRNTQHDLTYDELDLDKLMQYYRFEKREELLDFLKAQCIK